jgi:hypothetical protein
MNAASVSRSTAPAHWRAILWSESMKKVVGIPRTP